MWTEVTPSEFPHERAGLDFVKKRLPDREPYRAWSNFTFTDSRGGLNEVDLLVITPARMVLVELKGWPGRIEGDAGQWAWTSPKHDRPKAIDNPLHLADRKAKKLKSLLEGTKAARSAKMRFPYLESAIFLHADDLDCRLAPDGRHHVFGLDQDNPGPHTLQGIVDHLTSLDPRFGKQIGRPTSAMVAKAMEQAGIRQSAAHRKVGHFTLAELLDEGEDWQDYRAPHPNVPNQDRRIRLYPLGKASSDEERVAFIQMAQREVTLLQGIDHPAIERPLDFIKAQRGPAVVFPHDPAATRLDHWLTDHADQLDLLSRLDLVRLLAEGLRSAHANGLFHRGLSPRSVMVSGTPDRTGPNPSIRIRDWQTAARLHSSATARTLTTNTAGSAPPQRQTKAPRTPPTFGGGTQHVGAHISRDDHLYLAPEILTVPDAAPRTADIFSLGTLSILILTGQPPAADLDAKQALLRDPGHLSLAAVADPGLAEAVDRHLIRLATAAEPVNRPGTVEEFLDWLAYAEEELTTHDTVDPLDAKPGDVLDDTWTVTKRLGAGSTAVVLLANTTDGGEEVLKVARDADAALRLRDEHDVATSIRDRRRIVTVHDLTQIAGRTVLRMEAAAPTLARTLADDGPPSLDLLQRWGSDLLEAVVALEDDGLAHRDIKPDNAGIAPRGKNDERHLVLFDFSLSRANPEDLRAGTAGYLDPFLPDREQKRWDTHAERYAAAITLHEMATGTRPVWGDGSTDPTLLPADVLTPTLATELADEAIRAPLTTWATRALHRHPDARFDTAADMLQAWQRIFADLDATGTDASTNGTSTDGTNGGEGIGSRRTIAAAEVDLTTVTEATPIVELDLSARVTSALERQGVETVADLAVIPPAELTRLSGVGGTVRREITALAKRLRTHLDPGVLADLSGSTADDATASIDQIARKLVPQPPADTDAITAIRALLALVDSPLDVWPSQAGVAEQTDLDRTTVQGALLSARTRWAKRLPTITAARAELIEALRVRGGVASGSELAAALLTSRGSTAEEPWRTRRARAVVRAALEAEQSLETPRMRLRRIGDDLLVALESTVEGGQVGDVAGDRGVEAREVDSTARFAYAEQLGEVADDLVTASAVPTREVVLAAVRAAPLPRGMEPMTDARLLRLASEASCDAALSSRLELYPVCLPAARALAAAGGALLVRGGLTPAELTARVTTRFPAAEALPDRPDLDGLVDQAGIGLVWDGAEGRYLPPRLRSVGGTATTGTHLTSHATPHERDAAVELFDQRLVRLTTEGGFVAVTAKARQLAAATDLLAATTGGQKVDVDELLLTAMRRVVAETEGARWEAFEKADADPSSRGWSFLLRLVEQATGEVEQALSDLPGTIVVSGIGLLARYGQMGLLDRLRERLTREDGDQPLRALLVIVPGEDSDAKPMVDGVPVPVITTSNWTHVPSAWVTRQSAEAA